MTSVLFVIVINNTSVKCICFIVAYAKQDFLIVFLIIIEIKLQKLSNDVDVLQYKQYDNRLATNMLISLI